MTAAGDKVLAGIGLGVIAYLLFTTHDTANKFLAESLPVAQVVFFRSTTIVVGCLLIGRRRLIRRVIETPLKLPLAARGALTLSAWLLYFTASREIPLARLMTLYFSSPIMASLLAVPLLGERVTPSRWIALGLGFAGVCLASDPLGVRLSFATLMVLAAAALWGYAVILMRQIARRETSIVQIFYQNLTFLAVTGTITAFVWRPPNALEFALLAVIGVIGGSAQFLLFEGIRLAPASVMATVEYTGLIWAFILGYLVWGDIPALPTWLGAGLILASGVFLVVMERRRAAA